MHYDFTVTWSSVAALTGAIGVVWQVGKGVKAFVDFISFCRQTLIQHEQMWKAHCVTYDLDPTSGLPLVVRDE